jgi:hypothetical protein
MDGKNRTGRIEQTEQKGEQGGHNRIDIITQTEQDIINEYISCYESHIFLFAILASFANCYIFTFSRKAILLKHTILAYKNSGTSLTVNPWRYTLLFFIFTVEAPRRC